MSSLKYVIDFDTTTTIYKLGSGVVLQEPTVAAVTTDEKNKLKAIGFEARKFIGKTAEKTKIVFPVFEGEIVNENVAGLLCKAFLKKVGATSSLNKVECLFSVPCGASPEMLAQYREVARIAGIDEVSFVESPLLAAFGGRVPVSDANPFFMINMCGGSTSIAVLSLDGLLAGFSVNFGFGKVTTDIIDYVNTEYELQIGLLTAERIKADIASLDENDSLATIVNGRDSVTGYPKSITLKALDIITPVKQYYDKIYELAYMLISKLPPEVSAEIRRAGIYLSGEGSGVYGIENYFSKKFEVEINVSENPDCDACLGGGVLLTDKKMLKKFALKNN